MLDQNEPDAAAVVNPSGRSSFLLIGDHAGRVVPNALANLGLGDAELSRHIGWDIGIAELGQRLAAALDAVFIRQVYSRLVIDCNRDPGAADAIPAVSDGTTVPGNAALTAAARAARVAAIHTPYHAVIAAELERRIAGGQPTQLVALHSFTPEMRGFARPWHCGVLHNGANDALAKAMLTVFRADRALVVGDNDPYAMDNIDYTIPRHAFAAGLPYVEIEIRQDLLASRAGIDEWSARLTAMLPAALDLAAPSPT
ncbi:N-formylglutamate amidohydrolase [Glacieibacterium megasporae]|uniref:N-formylglutamate amidohydrolase n=1 Tax=Glacieibacterium megasporae TaxID=2835787 RepID=UPI001C1E7CBE|nr:N-formylglutamate amidohydrolase [Polymorphobacter megasporae]UAJ11159.1 N-formylglutamate amidohydrolase [Polymorphobacter megasporae]